MAIEMQLFSSQIRRERAYPSCHRIAVLRHLLTLCLCARQCSYLGERFTNQLQTRGTLAHLDGSTRQTPEYLKEGAVTN